MQDTGNALRKRKPIQETKLRNWHIFLLLALITIKVVVLLSAGPAAIIHDARDFWDTAAIIANGDPMLLTQPTAATNPLYAWLLGFVQWTPRPLIVLAVVQGAMYVGTVWMASSIAARVSRHQHARVVTLLLMLPAVSAVSFVGAVLPDTFFVFVLMLNLVFVLDYAKHQTNRRAYLVGLSAAGVFCLAPFMLWFWIAHLIFLLVIHYRRKFRRGSHIPVTLQHRAAHASLAAAAFLVVMLPWIIRNTYVFGAPLLTKSVGHSLWDTTFRDGHGTQLWLPETSPSIALRTLCEDSIDWNSDQWRSAKVTAKALADAGLNQVEADDLMRSVSLDAIRRDPPSMLKRSALRSAQLAIIPSTHAYRPRPNFRGFANYPQTWSLRIPVVTKLANQVFEWRYTQSRWTNAVLMLVTIGTCIFLIVQWDTRPYGIWIAAMLIYLFVVIGATQLPEYRLRIAIEPLAAITLGSFLAIKWANRKQTEPELDLELEEFVIPASKF